MAYKEIGGKRTYPKYKDMTPGQEILEGTFIREIAGKYGAQFEFEDKEGEIVVLNGAGQLKYKMGFVKENDKVKVIYEGEEILTSGNMKGKSAHQFTVLRDGAGDEFIDDSDQGLGEDMDMSEGDGLDSFDDL